MTVTGRSAAERSRWPRLRFALASLVVLAAAAGMFAKHASERLSALPQLRTVPIERRDLRITVGTTGTVEPDEVVEVGTLVAGRIIGFGEAPGQPAKPAEVGTRIPRGTILVQLDRDMFEVELQKARAAERLASAEVQRLETQHRQATREFERAQRLRATNSESDFDKVLTAHEMSQAELAIAQARREQALAEVRQAEINLSRTTIRSPIDGVVIDSRVNLGQNVSSAISGLFLLARNLDNMRIRASVSETDIGKIAVGQPVSFTVDAHRDVSHSGQVDKILMNAHVQGSFVTYDVLIAIAGATGNLLPHMTADVEFETVKRENAWLVPGESLQWWPAEEQMADAAGNIAPAEGATNLPAPVEGDHAYVWVPAGEGRVRSIPVRVGIDDGVHTQVIGDELKEQMPVVVGVIRETTLARIIPSVKTIR